MGGIYSPIRMALRTAAANQGEDGLGGAKDDETDFGRNAEAYWSADRSQTTVHINLRHGRRSRGEERGAEGASGGSVWSSAFVEGGREERALVQARDVVSNE